MNDAPPPTIWPSRVPTRAIGFAALAFIASVFFLVLWAKVRPEQRFYLRAYVSTGITSLYAGDTPKEYEVLNRGKSEKRWLYPRKFHQWMQKDIYHSKPLWRQFEWPMLGFLCLLIPGLVRGLQLDEKARQVVMAGQLLRGREIVDRKTFNKRIKGDGLPIRVMERRKFTELFKGQDGFSLAIKRADECKYVQISGDIGSGKTVLLSQIVDYVRRIGETCIIVDLKSEFIEKYYNAARGDLVCNVMDDRVFRWLIEREGINEPQFTSVSVGAFPDNERDQSWFNEHARAILAYLLNKYHPSVEMLCVWLQDEEILDWKLRGSIHANTLTKNAAPQRAGILGTLNKVAQILKHMPKQEEGRPTWSVRDYAAGDRRGWVFLTVTPDTKAAMLPVIRLWLDLFLLALQSTERKPWQKRCWIIADEATQLGLIPQMLDAYMLSRTSDNPIILGYQSVAMWAKHYGENQKDAMLSQAWTRIFLRTDEVKTAEYCAGMVGKRQVKKISESWTPGMFSGLFGRSLVGRWMMRFSGRVTYTTHEVEEWTVSPYEIKALPALEGYFVHSDMVVKIRVKPIDYPKVAKKFIPRYIKPEEFDEDDMGPPGALEKAMGTEEGPLSPEELGEVVRRTPAKAPEKDVSQLFGV